MKLKPWAAAPTIVCALCVTTPAASADTTVTVSASVLGGNQVNLPINAPINISGVAAGILGSASAGSVGGASVSVGVTP